MLAGAVLCAAGVLLRPVLGYRVSNQFAPASPVAFSLLAFAISAYLAAKGSRPARFYLLASGILLISVAIAAGLFLAGVPGSFITQYVWQLGVCVEAALLSLALADRIAQERKERFSAREAANRLKGFLPQRVAELVGGGDQSVLAPKRRNVTVCVIDLRGFTPFSETSAPEDVMAVLREFYEAMGGIVEKHSGTVEHFAGDSMLIFFNAPLEVANHEEHAVRAAMEMRSAFEPLRDKWSRHGHELGLGLGIGIADGYATIGAIGFSGRSQYARRDQPRLPLVQ